VIEVHNPTGEVVTALVRTARAVTDRMAVEERVTVPPGASIYIGG
jgi:hypothetical protein